MEHSDLGTRMKHYEQLTNKSLMPLLPVCIRLDGKAFHNFTKGLRRPYDERLIALMVETTKWLMEQTSAIVGYTQSDEISLIWLGANYKTQMNFGGRIQKLTSILAALCSVRFNKMLPSFIEEKRNESPVFDCRVWNVPTLEEAVNVLIWRQQDATRNSITMAAQSQYSHNQLMNKSSNQMQDMLFAKSINWNDYPESFKRGTLLLRRKIVCPFTPEELKKLPAKHQAHQNPDLQIERNRIGLFYPIITQIANRVGFLFEGEEPKQHE